MAELARGSVADRPWGRTFATLGLRGVTGQLTLVTEGKRFLVAFDHGAVVAAASPLTADAAVRVALTNHLVSSSQVSEIARRLASAPERDEVDVIAEQARLGPDHALRLRRRVIAQRAARTFSLTHGAFSVTDDTELTILEGCELDVRAVVYIGARANLSEDRLSAEVDLLGGWFRLKPGIDDDLPQFGFTDVEQPVVERLRDGGTLVEIEGFATSFVDGRTVRAVVYALAACGACAIEPSPALSRGRSAPARAPAPAEQPQPMARTMTQPMPRTLDPPRRDTGAQPMPRVAQAAMPPSAPAADPVPSARSTPGAPRPADETPAPPVPSKTTTRVSTAPPPPPGPGSLATGSTALRPPAEVFDAPTWRDADDSRPISGDVPERAAAVDRAAWPGDDAAGAGGATSETGGERAPASEAPATRTAGGRMRRPSGDLAPRESSNAALRLPVREALGLGTTSGSFHLPGDDPPVLRDPPSGPLRLPPDDPAWPDHPPSRVRRASEVVVRRDGSSGALRLSADDGAQAAGAGARRSGAAARREGSSGVIRLPSDEELRAGSSGVNQLPPDEGSREGPEGPESRDGREGSSGSIRLPPADALADAAGAVGARTGDRRRRPGSSSGLRMPLEAEAGPGVVVRRVTAPRPAPVRQVARVDTPAAHSVKAVIAQRLKLLDQGADHFQLLGVTHDIAAEALRKAYFALARQLHPDRLAALGISDDGKHAQRLFAQINAGFAVLSDPGRRTRYLDVLRRGGEAAVRAEQARAEALTRRILEAEEAFRRAELALRRDQPAAAVAELARAVELNPDEVDYRAALAWSRFCAAPDRQAVAAATRTALEAAIQRAPRAVTARFYLGRVERMLGRDPDALRHLREVLAVAPGHAEAAAEVRAIEARQAGGHGAPGRPRR